MPLENSRRALFKATYVPTKVNAAAQQPAPTRLAQKTAFLRSLAIGPHEFKRLRETERAASLLAAPAGNDGSRRPLLDVAQALVDDISPANTRAMGAHLAGVGPEDLAALGRELAISRQRVADEVASEVQQIETAYQVFLSDSTPGAGPAASGRTFSDAVAWAKAKRLPAFETLYSRTLEETGTPISAAGLDPVSLVTRSVNGLLRRPLDTLALVESVLDEFRVEPVGRLHLERIEMVPVGVEHGELLHSVPLTPKETVNITHREWSATTRTFEDIVSDSLEGYSEKGVAEKTDISQATDNESRHSSALDVGGNVSASYNGGAYSVSASASVDYNTKSDDLRSVKDSQAHSQTITQLASSRSRKEHKVSFRVSSVAGAENLAVQVLTNPSDTDAIRVDYFQLMRKWRVNLIRYGLRMTYDIVVPNPGLDLIGKVAEINQLKQLLSQDYTFSVPLSVITRASYFSLATTFNTEVDAPPADPVQATEARTLVASDGDNWTYGSVDFDVPEEYEIAAGQVFAHFQSDHGKDDDRRPWFGILHYGVFQPEIPKGTDVGQYDYPLDAHYVGMSGRISVPFAYYHLHSGELVITITLKPKAAAMEAWQLKVWNALREADLGTFNQRIQKMKDRLTELDAEIAAYDALTLRRMEREAIMKCVLQWLFGPKFKLVPDEVQAALALLDPSGSDISTLTSDQWQTMMRYGEFIKFIHNAVEWENILFFAYPYFWDAVKNWPFKRFLVHPDPEHREFLRAGSARVVLTVRPGFEDAFSTFVESWGLGQLPDGHPYVSIAEEIRNFAMTNYQGIPPANPDMNVRPLLYPEQRKTWSDMQVLIKLLEDYNTAQHQRTISTAVPGSGPHTVTPSSMAGIAYGTRLTVGADMEQEAVIVTKRTASTFTAAFTKAHAAGSALVVDPSMPMYPPTSDFPAVLQAFAGANDIPSKDQWGRPFHYTSPGLHGDYDLASFGANGKAGSGPVALDDDITSWAEGSVVAQWFEYTPTSAMDVAINTILATKPEMA